MQAITRTTRRGTISTEYALVGLLIGVAVLLSIRNMSAELEDTYEVAPTAVAEAHAAWGGTPTNSAAGGERSRGADSAPASPSLFP